MMLLIALFDDVRLNGDCLEHLPCWMLLAVLSVALFHTVTLNGDYLENVPCWIMPTMLAVALFHAQHQIVIVFKRQDAESCYCQC